MAVETMKEWKGLMQCGKLHKKTVPY